MLRSQKAVERLPPGCAIVGSGDGEVWLHETGERMSVEECASSRPVSLLSAFRQHVRSASVSVPAARPERSVAILGAL